MQKTTSYILAVFVAAAVYWGVVSTPYVEADRSAVTSGARDKWEYCSIVLESGRLENKGKLTATATIHYARTVGTVVEKVEQTGVNATSLDSELLGKAMAKLGADGWEMVTQGVMLQTMGGDQRRIYFKRRVSN